ncbi:conserved hypothetical protein [Desulfamplus magnetovallimortis]|uniref:Uncharacterized protein n=1 Tax=Desulfamplus magnetovallimortis TaxID=1246637 RepID=A0A1W1H4H1_9BACT|nr:hypothetical protein [Desulfamplus magnetovallimortis]SLM27342.1 conserved hypothetical protein [Desulfamplus magnetovallimortis]
MYEIIANPEDYQLDDLIKGTGNAQIEFSDDERQKWATEVNEFSHKLVQFSEKSQELSKVLSGKEKIITTPASLKTLKIQLFTINDALNNALSIAKQLESDIVPK